MPVLRLGHRVGAIAIVSICAAPAIAAAASLRPAPAPSPLAPPYDQGISVGNRLAMTLTNYGFFGNNFFSRDPSLEFPANSGYEHLPHGGLWVGAQAVDGSGSFTGVTTGTVDAPQGPTTRDLSEFTPAATLLRRSTDPASPYFSPDAISELDIVGLYDDLTPRQAASNPEVHRPLGVSVRQETYAWSWASIRDILFLHVVVRNTGAPLTNLWVGLYTEFASGNKDGYAYWPPATFDPGGLGYWYRKKWVVYEDSLRLVREHYCAGPPVPTGCQLQIAPPWIGLELLTPPSAGQSVTLAGWNFSPGAAYSDQDAERYAIMSSGNIQSFDVDSLRPAGICTGCPDPIEMLALGPFASVPSGDSIAADFAFVGGEDETAIHVNGIMARRVFDAGYQDVITPAQLSLASLSAAPGSVLIRWFGVEVAGFELRVERREGGGDWTLLGQVRAEVSGLVEFEDRSVEAGREYSYRLAWLEGGQERTGGEASIRVPADATFRLHGARPNPASGDRVRVAFSLRGTGAVHIRLLDLGGRVVVAQTEADLGPGEHLVPLRGSHLAPGIYVLELSQGSSTASARVAVIR
jgi:hypothetical protein